MLALLAAVVAVGCALASARRLAFAVDTSGLDASLLADALRDADEAGRRAVLDAIAARDDLPWERELCAACALADPAARDAAFEELVLERDRRSQRWARVPRVCASIAVRGGFLFAAVAVLQGLAVPPGDTLAFGPVLLAAVNAFLVGIAGMVFCVAAHGRARLVVRERLAATDRLVACLRSLPAGGRIHELFP